MKRTADQIEIKRLGQSDITTAQNLFMLLQQIFEVDHPVKVSQPYAEKLLVNPAFVVFVALHNNELVGGLTGYELPMYNTEASELYIYDIAVKPKFQRMGIGKKLIAATQRHCRENNIAILYVQADEGDENALDFYRSTRASEAKVLHFTYTISPEK